MTNWISTWITTWATAQISTWIAINWITIQITTQISTSMTIWATAQLSAWFATCITICLTAWIITLIYCVEILKLNLRDKHNAPTT